VNENRRGPGPLDIYPLLAEVADLVEATIQARLTDRQIEARIARVTGVARGTRPRPVVLREPAEPEPEQAPEPRVGGPRVWECAVRWTGRLRDHGLVDVEPSDLVGEAWLRVQDQGTPGDTESYLLAAIATLARARLRAARVAAEPAPVDDTGYWYDEAGRHARGHLTLRRLGEERQPIWDRLCERLGTPARADSVWRAAIHATTKLLLGSRHERWSLRETLTWAMGSTDEWWRASAAPGEPVALAMERRRARVRRDLPFVSYVVVWEGLGPTFRDDAVLSREFAQRHFAHVLVLLGEHLDPGRLAAVRGHLAEVRRATGST
jgi:hypothetical protein